MNKNLVIIPVFAVLMVLVALAVPQTINADLKNPAGESPAPTLVHNDHLTMCMLDGSHYQVVKTIKMVTTAYTDIPELTDSDPHTTASNKQVEYGMVATNILKFGTKVRIPELFGDEVFVVEDRMNSKYNGRPYLDVFLPTYKEAKAFGGNITNVEILEN